MIAAKDQVVGSGKSGEPIYIRPEWAYPNGPPVGTIALIGPASGPGGAGWTIGWKAWTSKGKFGGFAIFDGPMPEEGEYLRGVRETMWAMAEACVRSKTR